MSIGSFSVAGMAALGILPAVFWTYASAWRSTRRRERQFIRWAALLIWGLVAAYLAALKILPEAYAGLVFMAYCAAFLLTAGLLRWRLSQLREQNFPGSYLFSRSANYGR